MTAGLQDYEKIAFAMNIACSLAFLHVLASGVWTQVNYLQHE